MVRDASFFIRDAVFPPHTAVNNSSRHVLNTPVDVDMASESDLSSLTGVTHLTRPMSC